MCLDIGTMWKWAVQPALSRMCSFFLHSQSYLFDDTVKLLLPGGKMVVTYGEGPLVEWELSDEHGGSIVV